MYVSYQLLVTACEMHILLDLWKQRSASQTCSSNAIAITTETFRFVSSCANLKLHRKGQRGGRSVAP